MANFKYLLSIQQRLLDKSDEIEDIKRRKRTLMNDVPTNEKEIIALHFEIEFKKLELMHIKREQIAELRKSNDVFDKRTFVNQLDRLQKLNERCITLLVKRIFEEGYGQELKNRGLVEQYLVISPFISISRA